jgi:ribosome maturation factor RimP
VNDDFEELSRELRTAVGGDFRRTAEEDEQAARKAQLRSRTLEQVAFELLSRGDTVVLAAGDRRFQGVIVHAHGDLVTLETTQGEQVHAHLDGPVLLKVIERAAAGGRARDRYGAESFLARLRELELDEIPVELVAPGTREVVAGELAAVTKDHVMVTGDHGETWFIPLDQIATVKAR